MVGYRCDCTSTPPGERSAPLAIAEIFPEWMYSPLCDRREIQGGMVRLQLSLGCFTCSHREALIWSSPLWWEEEVTMSAVLPLSQTAGVWPPSVALGCGGPFPCLSSLQDNSRATKMWPLPTHAGERTREHTGESMTST